MHATYISSITSCSSNFFPNCENSSPSVPRELHRLEITLEIRVNLHGMPPTHVFFFVIQRDISIRDERTGALCVKHAACTSNDH